MIKDQSIFSLVIIIFIVMTFLSTLNQHCKELLKERCHAICVLFLKPKTFSHKLNSGNNGSFFFQNYRKSSIKPPGAYLFEAHLRRGLMETGGGGLCNLETTMVSVLHKELQNKMEKLKYKTF